MMPNTTTNMVKLTTGAATHLGAEHTVNEDAYRLPNGISEATLSYKGYLYILADGMGGHRAGNVASQLAVDIIRQTYYDDPTPDLAGALQNAIGAANAEIHRQGQDPAYGGMGSTVVAVVIRGTELIVANVGDSRAYLLRNGALQQLTADHTWVAERVAAGILTAEEAANHTMRNVITRSLGHADAVDVDVRAYTVQSGDRLLLCCDGVWGALSAAELTQLIGRGQPQQAADALVQRAVANGAQDDATALVIAANGAPRSWLGALWTAAPQWVVIGGVGLLAVALLLFSSLNRPATLISTRTLTPALTQSPTTAMTNTATPTATMEATATLTATDTPAPTLTATPLPPPPTPQGTGTILYEGAYIFRDAWDPYSAPCQLRFGQRVSIVGTLAALDAVWYQVTVPPTDLICGDEYSRNLYDRQENAAIGFVHQATVRVTP